MKHVDIISKPKPVPKLGNRDPGSKIVVPLQLYFGHRRHGISSDAVRSGLSSPKCVEVYGGVDMGAGCDKLQPKVEVEEYDLRNWCCPTSQAVLKFVIAHTFEFQTCIRLLAKNS